MHLHQRGKDWLTTKRKTNGEAAARLAVFETIHKEKSYGICVRGASTASTKVGVELAAL